MWLFKTCIFVCICFLRVKNQDLDNAPEDAPMLPDEDNADAPDGESEVFPLNYYQIRFTSKAMDAISKLLPDQGRIGLNAANINSTLEMYGDDSLFLDYGVHSEQLNQPLLVGTEKALHYRVLVSTPHGRHLLLVSLLEQLNGNMWNDRCGGKLKIFLSDSLRSPDQPPPPYNACLLDDIVVMGEVVQRDTVMKKFDELVPQDEDFEIFSWYKEMHRDAINNLAEWVLEGETFGSSYSLLVTIREWLSRQMFVELVNLVIAGRGDTGFVMPSMESYMPEDFFEQDILTPLYGNGINGEDVEVERIPEINVVWDGLGVDMTEEENEGRDGRVWVRRGNGWQWVDARTTQQLVQPVVTTSRPVDGRWEMTGTGWQWVTTPQVVRPVATPSRPAVTPTRGGGGAAWGTSGMTWSRFGLAEAEWYFREDPVANAHHSEWHRGGGGGARRGESFYYMHGQMLARYEAERLSLGLGLTTHFGPALWNSRIRDSYDPRLGSAWSSRPSGTINAMEMRSMVGGIQNLAWTSASYSGGVDRGINNLGRSFERGLHNVGHVAISGLSRGRGVMGSTVGAMRDPIFYRWHGFVDSVFNDYKNRLNRNAPYSEADLGFPDVRLVSASVQSQGGAANTFYTYREMATVRLNSLDSNSPGNRMSVQYLRMNHRPFTWNIVVNSNLRVRTPAIVRIFMMPRNGGRNRATIHMDHFFMDLNPGENRVTRDEMEAPHLSKSRWSLNQLQNNLMNGQVGRGDFSWGGCGWPRHLNVPRGTTSGMAWTLVVMVSQVLDQDISRLGEWRRNSNFAWSYCGVRGGLVPDSRPMGFPVDRDYGNIDSLARGRDNWSVGSVTIRHGNN